MKMAGLSQSSPTPRAPEWERMTPNARRHDVRAPVQDTVELSPPRGTDPELWQVLSPTERATLSRLEVLGPLTYGRIIRFGHLGSPLPRGGRIDARA